MRTHNKRNFWPSVARPVQSPGWLVISLCLAGVFIHLTGCKKEAALDAMETDANGYLCLKCGAKLYTDRSVFIGPKCPQCNQDTLMPTIGFYCEKDQHLTIRSGDRQ